MLWSITSSVILTSKSSISLTMSVIFLISKTFPFNFDKFGSTRAFSAHSGSSNCTIAFCLSVKYDLVRLKEINEYYIKICNLLSNHMISVRIVFSRLFWIVRWDFRKTLKKNVSEKCILWYVASPLTSAY